MGEPLEQTPVYRNLSYRSSWFGLTPLHIPVVLVPSSVVLLACMALSAPTWWGLACAGAIVGALAAGLWRKPEDHLQRTLCALAVRRGLSHKGSGLRRW